MPRQLTITVNVPDHFDHSEGADEVHRAAQEWVDENYRDDQEDR